MANETIPEHVLKEWLNFSLNAYGSALFSQLKLCGGCQIPEAISKEIEHYFQLDFAVRGNINKHEEITRKIENLKQNETTKHNI